METLVKLSEEEFQERLKAFEQMADAAAKRVQSALVETVREVEEHLQLDLLLGKLYDYPQLIRDQQDAVSIAKQKADEALSEVELQTALLQAEIAQETGPGGKAKFSNDTMRRAELARRQAENTAYKAAVEALVKAEDIHRSAQFDLERLNNEFASIRRAIDLQGRRLALIGRIDQ